MGDAMRRLTGWLISVIGAAMLVSMTTQAAPIEAPLGPDGAAFAAGQVWTYQNRPEDDGSTLTILKIEEQPGTGARIVHIRVDGVHLRGTALDPGVAEAIAHLPYDEAALRASVTDFIGIAEPIPDFAEGYAQWQAASGGVFSVPVRDAVGFVAVSVGAAESMAVEPPAMPAEPPAPASLPPPPTPGLH